MLSPRFLLAISEHAKEEIQLLLFSSRLLAAMKSDSMRFTRILFYSVLSNLIWKSVKSNIMLSGHISKNSQTKILMAEAFVNT